MALTLEEALARVPHWAGATDLKATPLEGGITNNNFRVDVGGNAFVLRIAGADTELLGINRENEYTANLAAGKLGIAPEVFYFIRPEGYLVTRFIHGRPILTDEICEPQNLKRVMEVVRRIHNLPEIPGTFNVFRIVEEAEELETSLAMIGRRRGGGRGRARLYAAAQDGDGEPREGGSRHRRFAPHGKARLHGTVLPQ